MTDVQLKLEDNGRGTFIIEDGGERIGEMEVALSGNNLTVFHTQVSDQYKGQGLSTKLLTAMVLYVRQHNKKVIPLCPYVSAQFNRHPEQYADIWNKDWHK